MRKQWKLAAIACVLAIAALFVLFLREREPRYEGRSLSEWLTRYRTYSAERGEAERAVLAIGTNALPCVLDWMAYEPPLWRARIMTKWDIAFLRRRDYLMRYTDATFCLMILGTNAAPAVPRLAVLMNSGTTNLPSKLAVRVLCLIGDPALPVLASALKDPKNPMRARIPSSIAMFPPTNISTNDWLPMLTEALRDSDYWVRWNATNALKVLTPSARTD